MFFLWHTFFLFDLDMASNSNRKMPTSEEIQKLMADQEGSLGVREAFLKKDIKTNNLTEDLEELKEELENAKRTKNAIESHINTLSKYVFIREQEQKVVHRRDKSK